MRACVVVAEPGKNWIIHDWDDDLELADGIPFNIGRHLREEGVNPDAN